MDIFRIVNGPVSVNTYIISAGSECVVIDPGTPEVDEYLVENGLKCTYVLLTHGHFDHIGGAALLQQKYGAKVCIHENEKDALTSDKVNLGAYVGTTVAHCTADVLLHGGEVIEACGCKFRVLNTPGHSSGSVCFMCDDENTLFSGDTLFNMSVGRTDLPGSSTAALEFSVMNVVYALPGGTRVLPGHEDETTIEFEKENNPYTARMSN